MADPDVEFFTSPTRVNPQDQKLRDKDALAILQSEYDKMQQKLAAGIPAGVTDPQYMARTQTDLAALAREISRKGGLASGLPSPVGDDADVSFFTKPTAAPIEQQIPQTPFFGNPNIAKQGVKAGVGQRQDELGRIGGGVLEAGLGAATAAINPIIAGIKGVAQSIRPAIETGQPPQPIGQQIAEKYLRENPSYQPPSPTGQGYLRNIASLLESSKLPPSMIPEVAGFAPLAGPAVSQATRGAGQALQDISAGAGSVAKQLQDQLASRQSIRQAMAERPAAPVAPVAPGAPSMTSGGAAAVAPENSVRAALAEATPELQANLANKTSYTPQDLQALEIHNKFRKIDPDFVPTQGQARQDVALLSDEYNQKALPGNEDLRAKFEQRDPFLIKGFNNVKENYAPSHSGVGQEGKANNILEDIKTNHVDVDTANIKNAYKALESEDGKFPIDSKTFANNALIKLNEYADIDFLPQVFKNKLDKYLSGEKDINLNEFENLRTQSARAMRSSSDGNEIHALSLFRNALEELPMTGENAIKYKDLADTARTLFRTQKELLTPPTKNAPNPKYNKAYAAAAADTRTPDEIAQGNVAHPAAKGFFDNFVTNPKSSAIDVNRLVNLVGKDSPSHHEMVAGIVDAIKRKAGVVDDSGNISQAALNKELVNLGSKLDLAVGSEAANELRNIGDVARLSENVRNRSGGTANVSQTAITTAREAAQQAARDLALGAGEAALNIKTGGVSGVVGSVLKPIFKAKQEQAAAAAAEAARIAKLRSTISPTAGIGQ